MLYRVKDYIRQNNMIEQGDRIVVGVSGGADSICLLDLLQEICGSYQAELLVVHVNHGIRGEQADQDEQFVKNICEEQGIPFHRFYYNVREIAQTEGLTEEETGRNVRYKSFLEICGQFKCNKIAIAHNRNDNAETILFHMFRGSGSKGLAGIDPVREVTAGVHTVKIIRPLLEMQRWEIEAYLRERQITYRTDATNLTEDYARNKIRRRILSYAQQEINTNTIQHITDAAYHIREMDLFIEKQVKERFLELVMQREDCYFFSVCRMRQEEMIIQKGILRLILARLAGGLKDLESKHVEQILSLYEKQVGRYLNLPYGIIAKRDYENILIYLKGEDPFELQEKEDQKPILLTIPGKHYLSRIGKVLIAEIIYEKIETIPKNSCTKWFDYDKIENAVVIRTRRAGDYIQINQSGGRKKLKDYFIDQKVPVKERSNRLLLTDGSHVIWILGEESRISERYKVDDSTDKILLMKLIDMEEI